MPMQDAFDEAAIDEIDDRKRKKGATKPAASTVPATVKAATTPATAPGVRLVNPLDLYLETEDGPDVFFDGEFLNFNGQTGVWSLGQNKSPIGATTAFICNVRGIAVGNIKMVDGKIVDREIGLISEGYQRKPPELLPDRDKRYWPYNKLTNEREDPWKPTAYLPMRNMENDEPVVFALLQDRPRRDQVVRQDVPAHRSRRQGPGRVAGDPKLQKHEGRHNLRAGPQAHRLGLLDAKRAGAGAGADRGANRSAGQAGRRQGVAEARRGQRHG